MNRREMILGMAAAALQPLARGEDDSEAQWKQIDEKV